MASWVWCSIWLASLSPDQRRKAQFGFPAEEQRTLWYYTPNEQGGLPLVEMDPVRGRLAHRLLAAGLSLPGYATTATIMGLENTLDALEGWRRSYSGRREPNRGRDPLLYFVSVFGDPATGSWAWRVGGHHLSLSYTVVDGQLASPTPVFFGANPAEAPLVGPSVLRTLAGEEDLGRELLHTLDADQRAVAVLSAEAPPDIVQTNRPHVEPDAPPPGMPERLAVLRSSRALPPSSLKVSGDHTPVAAEHLAQPSGDDPSLVVGEHPHVDAHHLRVGEAHHRNRRLAIQHRLDHLRPGQARLWIEVDERRRIGASDVVRKAMLGAHAR